MIPRLPLKFLKWFCRPEYHIDVEGDLIEIHEKRVQLVGRARANLLLWRDVILLVRPGMVRSLFESRRHNALSLFHHNILISFRNFWKRKTSFLINLASLSTALTCALLIYTWIADEVAVDKFHENDERIYRILANYSSPTGIRTIDVTPSPLAEALVAEMPEVEYAVSMCPYWGQGIIDFDNKQLPTQALFASADFFKVFSYKVLHGNNKSLMISKSQARKLFQKETDAIGKLVDWNHTMRLQGPFEISGVFEDVPANSTVQFDAIFPYEKLAEADRWSRAWNSTYSQTTLLLHEGTDAAAFNKKIAGFVEAKEPKNKCELVISRYSDKYLYDEGRITYVRLFSLVAIFTLAIASVNFVNLSTAQASRKMKEVGVKKTLGANRGALIAQFLTESMILTVLSLIIATVLTAVLLPTFNQLTGKRLVLDIDLKIVGLALGVGILAGAYPAFFLSKFKPATVLKGRLIGSTVSEVFIRKGLVILQFTISIVFIAAFVILNRQIDFVQTSQLGYSKENVISFYRRGNFEKTSYEAFIAEIRNVPGVLNASSMSGSILNEDNALHVGFSWEGQTGDEKLISFPSPSISHDYVETLGIELKEGRTFSKDHRGEETKMVVNEAAVKLMGLTNPIGSIVNYGTEPKEIIGVVKDFQYGSMHSPLKPVFLMYAPSRNDIVVRLQPGFEVDILEKLEVVYRKYHPGYAFNFTFLDDDYNALYVSDTRVSSLSTYFAIVATLISCLGLFGLAVFSSERRMKEIGIRKVLGATSSTIARLLASDILIPVFVAIVFAIPISYLIGRNWLAGFAYRIELSWWFFGVAAITALLVTFITVGLQTLRAAQANPVDSLKSE